MNRSVQVAAHVLAGIIASTLIAGPARANWPTLPNALQISTTKAYSQVRTASDGAGGMFVAWRDSLGVGVNNPLWIQRIDWLGAPQTWVKKINDGGYPNAFVGQYMQMDICSDDAKGVFVAYEDWFNNGFGNQGTRTWLTRLDSNGNTLAGFPVQLNSGSGAERPAVCSDGSGNAIVAWADQKGSGCDSNNPWQLLAQKVDATGHRLWPSGGVAVSGVGDLATDLNNEPAMRPAPTPGGGAYFTWTGFDASCNKTQIKAQLIDAGGGHPWSLGGIFVISGSAPVANCLASGSEVIVTTFDPSFGVFVKRIDSSGSPVWTQQLDVTSFTGATASDGLGGVFVAWFTSHGNGLLVQDVDFTSTLKLPDLNPSTHGTYCADLTFMGLPFPPVIVRDGKQGALVLTAGPGPNPSLQQARAVGVSYTGRPAFPLAGLAISPAGQTASALSGVPGYMNNGLFAWGNPNGVWAQVVTLSDLDATTAPPGWAAPIVPRSLGGATFTSVQPTPQLFTDADTYLNWVIDQRGPNPTPAFESRLFLDGVPHWALDFADGAGPGFTPVLNFDVGRIHGGPHTLTLYTDDAYNRSIDEANEADDEWSMQWTWEPSWAYASTSLLDQFPGLIGTFGTHNGNGQKFHVPGPLGGGGINAWVVSDAARRGPTFDGATGGLIGYGDSEGLELYDLPVGAPEYTHLLAASHQPYNGTNFVLGLSSAAPESLYTLEVRDSTQDANPDSSWFSLQTADTRSGAVGTSWMNQSMAAGDLADVYVINAVVRQPIRITVRRHEPGPNQRLAFELFAPGSVPAFHRGQGFGSLTHDADSETLTVVATRTGPYVAVVYRADGSNAGTPLAYDLQTSSTQTLDAPAETAHELSFARVTPNPASGPMQLGFTLPTSGAASLAIYDVNGRRVRELLAGVQDAGEHRIRWDATQEDGSRARSGLYFARLTFAGRTLVHRLTLLD